MPRRGQGVAAIACNDPSGSGAAVAPSVALAAFPRSLWVLSSWHHDRRAGLIVDAVIPCGTEPTLVCVAARKGHPIEPLIRDSHRFALSILTESDRVLMRRFDAARSAEDAIDPFEGLDVRGVVSGAPVLAASSIVLDCDVHRHVDIEADRQLYIGLVLGGWVNGRTIIPRDPPEFDPDS